MAAKKGKGGGKGSGGKGKTGTKPPQAKQPGSKQNDLLREPQQTPQERVDAVRPLWESLSPEQRLATLTIDLESLRQRSCQLTEAMVQQQVDACDDSHVGPEFLVLDAPMEELLEEGMRRLADKGTWKVWCWGAAEQQPQEFYDAESFRTFVTENHIREELRRLLPRDDSKAPEKPAEAAFRQRMLALLQKVQQSNRQSQEEMAAGRTYRRRHMADTMSSGRNGNVELIHAMLEALSKEHECIYLSLMQPLAMYIMEVLPEGGRKTAKTDLALEDLERLEPDHAACIVEWLTEKVDSLSTKLKADPKEDDAPEDEEENMGDVDLWTVVEKDGSKSLAINDLWLQHLQDRLLGDDGQPRKVKPGEDPHSSGLVLEWVYGSIVSTAEKARDSARRNLGSYLASTADAHAMLLRALEDYYIWETRGKQAKELMSDMLKSRLEMKELAKQYDVQAMPRTTLIEEVPEDPGEAALPDYVIAAMLQREALLTKAKLHFLMFEHLQQEKAVRQLTVQLRQGEPEFERLKRELDEVKHQPRCLDATFRSAAETERHRAQLADAAMEEQLEVQTAFREQGARLQSIYDKKQRSELEMGKRQGQIKQLQAWKATVESILEQLNDVMAALGTGRPPVGEARAAVHASSSQQPAAELSDGLPAAAETAKVCSSTPTTPESAAGTSEGAAAAAGGGEPIACDGAVGERAEEASRARAGGAEDEEPKADSGNATGACADGPQPRPAEASPQQYMQLSKLRSHFLREVRRQLYGDAEDRQLFESFKQEVKVVEKRLEEARVALQHLEMALINTACDDPGITIGMQLALPILQERLDARALEYAAERAKLAEGLIIKMELEQQEREAAERERRIKAKQSKKDKARSERDKAAAEKAAEKAAEEQRRAEEEIRRKQEEEEERRRRQQQMEQLRKEEEEYMEKRRLELLSDENGYWRRRMDAEAQAQAIESARAQVQAEAEAEAEAARHAVGAEKRRRAEGADTREAAAGVRAREQEADTAGRGRANGGSNGGAFSGRQPYRERRDLEPREGVQHNQSPGACHGSHRQARELPQGSASQHSPATEAQPGQSPRVAAPAPAGPAIVANAGAGVEAAPVALPSVQVAPVDAHVTPGGSCSQALASQQQQQPSAATQMVMSPTHNQAAPQQPPPASPVAAAMLAPQGPQQGPMSGPPGPPLNPMAQMMAHPMHHMHGMGVPPGAQQHLQPGAHRVSQEDCGGPIAAPMPMHMPGHFPAHPHPHHMMQPGPMYPYHHGPAPPGHPGHAHPGMMHHPHALAHPGMMHHPHPHPHPHPAMMHPHPAMMQAAGPAAFGVPSPHPHPHPYVPPAIRSDRPIGAEPSNHVAATSSPTGQPAATPAVGNGPVAGAGAGAASVPQPASGKSKGLSICAKPFVPASVLRPPAGLAPPAQPQAALAPEERAGTGAAAAAGAPVVPSAPVPATAAAAAVAAPATRPNDGNDTLPHCTAAPPHQPADPRRNGGALHVDTRLSPELRQQQERRQLVQAQAPAAEPSSQTSAHNRAARGRRDTGNAQALGEGLGGRGQQVDGLKQRGAAVATSIPGCQGNGRRPTLEDSYVGCCVPLSPLAHLDAVEVEADASDSSQSTWDERQEPELEQSMTPARRSSGSAAELVQVDSDEAEGESVPAPRSGGRVEPPPPPPPPASPAAAAKRPSWSSVAAGGGVEQAGPVRAAEGVAGTTWKQKLRQSPPPPPPPPPPRVQAPAPQHALSRGRLNSPPPAAAAAVSRVPPPTAAAPGAGLPGSGSCTSAALMSEVARPLPGSLRKTADSRFEFEPVEQPGQAVLLRARALMNRGAQNNCFLNVILQSMWHLPSFRQPMLELAPEALQPPVPVPAPEPEMQRDVGSEACDATTASPAAAAPAKRVMQAVFNILQAMEAPPAGPAAQADAGGVISPQELREALFHHSAPHVDPGDMQDAGEVLADILNMMHHEELGQPLGQHGGAADLQLPTRVQVPEPAAAAANNGDAVPDSAAQGSVATGSLAAPGVRAKTSLVQRVFGLDLQLPHCPAGGGSGSGGVKPSKLLPQGEVAKGAIAPGPVREVQQYTKFSHLVHAQRLRKAAAARPQGSFEELLAEVEHTSGGPDSSSMSAAAPSTEERCTLLRLPAVFTLALVWESAQVPVEALRGTVEALGSQLQLSRVFRMDGPAAATYALRSVVCYFGRHYLVFALSEQLGLWLLFDDEKVTLVGQWADVCRALVARRLQPSLLFFDAAPASLCARAEVEPQSTEALAPTAVAA